MWPDTCNFHLPTAGAESRSFDFDIGHFRQPDAAVATEHLSVHQSHSCKEAENVPAEISSSFRGRELV